MSPTPFGHEMLRKHFLINPKYRPLNHGGYGTFPRSVLTAQREFQDEVESRVDASFNRTRRQHIDVSRKAIAELVHARVDECVFVTNTSIGLDIILRNLEYKDGDAIVVFSTVYYAVANTLMSLMETTPVQNLKVELVFPLSHDEIVQRFLEVVRQGKKDGLNVRAAIFDTICSVPGVRFPFERLVKACKDENVMSIVDGAHGIGQIPLNLDELDPEFFLTNCHKWLYTPRGCALFYVPKRNQHFIRTSLPTGVGYTAPSKRGHKSGGITDFEALFDFIATSDDTPFMCIPAALKFRAEVCGGEDAIYGYLQKIVREGSDKVAQILGTDVMQEPGLVNSAESEIRKCALVNVRIPLAFRGDAVNTHLPHPSTSQYPLMDIKDAEKVDYWMKNTLMTEFDTYVKFFPHVGWMWARFSGQIYLELEDFEWIGKVLVDLCERVGKGEWKED